MPNVFADRETQEIVEIIRRHRHLIFDARPQYQPNRVRHMPAHYHVKITQTISPAVGDIPGCGKGIIERYDTGTQRMVTLFPEPQRIHQVGNIPIRRNARLPVHTDPWGTFWVDAIPSMFIQFIVASIGEGGVISVGVLEVTDGPGEVSDPTEVAESSSSESCPSTDIPGVDEDDIVQVFDTMGCLTVETGMVGWAHWVRAIDDDGETTSGYWSILSLCCP